MSVEDHSTFVAMGKAMASLNGYKAEQSSDLYITDGDQIDWMYGVHRIFSFTWELYPPETGVRLGRPLLAGRGDRARRRPATAAPSSTSSISAAARTARSAKETTHCGAFNDDFEIYRFWSTDPYGTDTATGGDVGRGAIRGRRSPVAIRSSSGRRRPGRRRW